MPKQLINQSEPRGFTIIEVVLVLAIAGLIFLMVFVALPALQRSQRDTQRRNDMSRVDTSLVQFQTNNMSAGNNTTALPEGPSFWSACKEGTFEASGNGENAVECTAQANVGDSASEGTAKEFVRRYMNSGTDSSTNSFQDPDGVFYSMYISENIGGKTLADATVSDKGGAKLTKDASRGFTIASDYKAHIIYIIPGGKCEGEYVKPDTSRHFAVMYRLEGAGVYCIDDQ